MDKTTLAEMAEMYERGASLQAVGEQFACSAGTVANHFHAAGIPCRPRGMRPGHGYLQPRRVTEDQERQAASAYREGSSIEEIAEDMGLGKKAVVNSLRRQNVKMRTSKEAAQWVIDRRELELGPRIISRSKNEQGYIILKLSPSHPMYHAGGQRGFALEHRFVMAESLGRPLTKTETVHHINGIRDDNRLENLQLRHGKHGNGHSMVCADCGSHNVVASELAAG